MKKTFLLVFLFAYPYLCQAQTPDGIKYLRMLRKQDIKQGEEIFEKLIPDSTKEVFYRVEISQLTGKSTLNSGWDSWSQFLYSGDIVSGLLRLFQKYPISRLRVQGKVPEKHISFCGFRPQDWNSFATKTTSLGNNTLLDSITEPVNKMIFDVLREKYKFSVSNIEDTCEVWIAKVINQEQLSNFVTKNNKTGVGGGGILEENGKMYLNIDYIALYALWTSIEDVSKHIIYDETNDYRKFTVGPIETTILKDFDMLNSALELYGLRLFKEKRLEKLKLVEFHE